MHVTIKGLRQWIVGAAVLLVAVVAGFLLYGRYRFQHLAKDLPERLGANIQETANGFTYTQSSGGHTLFTLKASKEIQLRAGHVMLHDVDITTYGPPGSGRTDHIYGNEFAYDQNTGIATSRGEVKVDLEGLSSKGAGGGNAIHVRTQGLTFAGKTGVATATGPVSFEFPRASGSSVGANYNSKTGVLVLTSQVRMTTSGKGKTATVTADEATLLREQMQAQLKKATIDFRGEQSSADEAIVSFRKDGSAKKIDARGDVRVRTATGGVVRSRQATILTNAKSQPERAEFAGGVRFALRQTGQAMHGTAQEGTLLFVAAGGQTRLRRAVFLQDVRFDEQAKDKTGSAERTLRAQRVDVTFSTAGPRVEAQRALAEGNPVLTMKAVPAKGAAQMTRMSGEVLTAELGPGNVLREVDGRGGTRMVSTSADGARETSQGDVLRATFRPAAEPKGKEKRGAVRVAIRAVLETATQDGHVMLTEVPAKKAGGAEPVTMTAWADHAEYRAADQVLELTGHPRLQQGGTMGLSAETIDYHRAMQDATASGDVKATYAGNGSQKEAPSIGGNGPVEVIADRATMRQAKKQSYFYGTEKSPARIWQGSNSLQAPEIEIDRDGDVLKAGGGKAGGAPVVRASFVSSLGVGRSAGLVQVWSRTLVYSGEKRRGDFQGSVTARQGHETIQAGEVQVFLKPAATGKAEEKPKTPGPSSEIERLVASGDVVLREPGRRGEGTKLVYTAANGQYVLSGTAEKPPKLWDRTHGTTRGEAVIFSSRTGRVEVRGGKAGAVTETRAPR